jgi:carbon monoxide dehydrogenase subunit G
LIPKPVGRAEAESRESNAKNIFAFDPNRKRYPSVIMIEINEQFDVPSARPRFVWDLLSDPHDVVGCVPGAALGEEHEDGSFDGSLTVKFGPAKVTFRARIELELDEAAMTGRVTARGKDNQGGTRFRASMSFAVTDHPEDSGTTVLIKGENEITGKLAGIVEAGAKIVIKRMAAEFSENLAARCAGANTA